MKVRKILSILIFICFLFNLFACFSTAQASDIETRKKETQKKIKHLKWLESLEQNKLYKNQQKLENAETNLVKSENEILSAQKELSGMETQLRQATREYENLNSILASHIRKFYKAQRSSMVELIIMSEDVNMLQDRLYFKKLILQEDYDRMKVAKQKARQIALLKHEIEARKRNYELYVASINAQKSYIKNAISKNKDMIKRLETDRVAYERAEKELKQQSKSIQHYISRNAKDSSTSVIASGFIKPISGRITSPFGYRVHPIFNSKTFHSGVDIGGQNLAPIKASNSGKVIYSGWYGGYGKVVIIEHGIVGGKPLSTLYAHMSSIKAVNGQHVKKGDVIGYEGSTGYSTGPHCHFEVRENGRPSNPASYVAL